MSSNIIAYDSTVNPGPDADPEQLKFHTEWTWGGFKSLKKTHWKPESFGPIRTVADMWFLLNHSINANPRYMAKRRPERWLFREKFIPDWDVTKTQLQLENLYQLSIVKLDSQSVIKIILLSLGETLPRGENLLGIRIKPNNYGGEIRLWVKCESDAETMKKFLCQFLGNSKTAYQIEKI